MREKKFLHLDIHPSSTRREIIGFFLPLSLAVLLVSVAGWAPVFLGTKNFAFGLVWHLLLTAGVAVTLPVFNWFHCDMRLPVCLAIVLGLLGPIGGLCSFLVAFLYSTYLRFTVPMTELLDQLFPEEGPGHEVEKLAQRIERGLENIGIDTTAIPFMDIMNFGSVAQKLRAIGLSLRYFHPVLAPVLHKGLQDPDNSVRVLSATSLLALEQQNYDTYLFLQSKVKADPHNRVALLALAEHAEAYARSGVLSPERVTRMLEAAKGAYKAYGETGTFTDALTLSIARIDLQLGHIEEALRALERLCTSRSVSIEAYKLLCTALFQQGDYVHLKERCERPTDEISGSERDKVLMHDLMTFWCTGKANA